MPIAQNTKKTSFDTRQSGSRPDEKWYGMANDKLTMYTKSGHPFFTADAAPSEGTLKMSARRSKTHFDSIRCACSLLLRVVFERRQTPQRKYLWETLCHLKILQFFTLLADQHQQPITVHQIVIQIHQTTHSNTHPSQCGTRLMFCRIRKVRSSGHTWAVSQDNTISHF